MEEEKATAYYDEIARKGEAAARFKVGLGFTADGSSGSAPIRGSAVSSSSSSFLSTFVRASSPSKVSEFEKQKQLETIQNKLKKKPSLEEKPHRVSESRDSRHSHGSLSRSRERGRERTSTRRSRSSGRRRYHSRSRERGGYRNREKERDERKRRRSRSRSVSDDDGARRRGGERGRGRSGSPRRARMPERCGGVGKVGNDRNGGVDYSRLIEGYDKMTPAERVKAKMKLQLSETVEKDATMGTGSGWERFDFNKDAPLDDEEIEAAEDDAALVKHIGQSFRFSAVETKREEEIKAAHDEAMFGASVLRSSYVTENDQVEEDHKKESNVNGITTAAAATSLINDKVLTKQQGSWRDRARKT